MKVRFLAGILIAIALLGVGAQATYMMWPSPRVGWDFAMRVNEVKCIRDGVDPYAVWRGDVHHAPYRSMSVVPNPATGEVIAVNAYPPWEYTFLLPVSFLTTQGAWALHFFVMLLILLLLAVYAFRWARCRTGVSSLAWIVSTMPMLLMLLAIGSCFQSGNYPIVVLAATLGLVWCLDRGHDILAGLCWAVAMIKPQIALLFAVPLLLRGKIRVCVVAAVTCVLASVWPAIRLGKNPVALIVEGLTGSSGAFAGCGTFPYGLCLLTGGAVGTVAGLLIGALIVVWLIRKMPKDAGWFLLLAPTAAVSTVWTYSPLYTSVLLWPLFFLFALHFVSKPRRVADWLLLGFLLVFCTRVYTYYHGFTMLFLDRFGYADSLHAHLDSFNALFILLTIIAVMFRCVIPRERAKG